MTSIQVFYILLVSTFVVAIVFFVTLRYYARLHTMALRRRLADYQKNGIIDDETSLAVLEFLALQAYETDDNKVAVLISASVSGLTMTLLTGLGFSFILPSVTPNTLVMVIAVILSAAIGSICGYYLFGEENVIEPVQD